MADVDEFLLVVGAVILGASPWLIRRRWTGKDNEDRLVRDGVPRPLAVGLTAGVAWVPVMGVACVLSSDLFDHFAWSKTATGIAFLLMICLPASLVLCLFPKFLIPPRLRHEQSLASLAFFGPRTPNEPR